MQRTPWIVALLASTATAHAATVTVAAKRVLDVDAGRMLTDQVVTIDEGRIVAVSGRAPGAAVTFDLGDVTLLPGLIDAHTHLAGGEELSPDQDLRQTDARYAVEGVANARKTLLAGFTTVRDVGSDGYSIHALRDAVNEGVVVGPRILLSGTSLSIVGGHGDMSGLNRKATEALYPYDYTGACTGGAECALRVREAAKYGADLIKITSTGGIMSQQARGLGQHLTDEELTAIVTTAHSLGLKVAAHAHGGAGVAASVRAGVDSIEHGTWLDEATARQMAARASVNCACSASNWAAV